MGKRVRIQSRVTAKGLGTGTMVNERWSVETLYEGMQVKVSQVYLAKTHFVHRDTITRNGKIQCYVGDTQDIVNDDLTTETRMVSTISGRDKQVNNKKAQGQLRKDRFDSKALSFGVSRSKAYHKAKHS